MARGTLRIYLGFAPGAGTTYALLDEGRRRYERGTDVVLAALDTHGRSATEAQTTDLPVVGTSADGHLPLDAAALLARRPDVALVDDLAAAGVLDTYALLPAVRGDLLAALGRRDEARAAFERAAALTDNTRERAVMLRRAAEQAATPG